MKFYLAKDAEGKKQLRGTKELILKVSKDFEIIEIPTDKEGLEHLVQDSFNAIFALEGKVRSLEHDLSIQPVPGPSADPAPAVPQPAPVRSGTNYARSFEATEIEDFILNRAAVHEVESIHSCLGCRFAELVKENKKLRD